MHTAGMKLPIFALAAAVAASVWAVSPSRVVAQDNWLENVFGGQSGSYTPRKTKRKVFVAPEPMQNALVSRERIYAMEVAIARYQEIVRRGGWKLLPNKTRLRVDSREEEVVLLRRQLLMTGDMKRSRGTDYHFDEEVRQGLIRFQLRHGIRPSGMVDRWTLRVLRVSAQERLEQLRLNLNRLLELQDKVAASRRYVVVNTASQELQAVAGGRVAIASRVIAGKPAHQTPNVSVMIKGLNFYPYWRVPVSIANRDIIPRIKKDPMYLRTEHIRVLDKWGGNELDPQTINWDAPESKAYRFRQDAGNFNALGVVRIDMPNEHIVYMHDTPMKPLFKRLTRAYSAGCVRVERVIDVAKWLVSAEEGWNDYRVDTVLGSGYGEDVKLKEPVPVHFTYVSAWADPKGNVSFREDIYGRDVQTDVRVADFAGDPDGAPARDLLSP